MEGESDEQPKMEFGNWDKKKEDFKKLVNKGIKQRDIRDVRVKKIQSRRVHFGGGDKK